MSNPELPGYDLLERLPSGGVWTIFKARQLSLNRMVIVKFLATSLLEGEGDSKPFIFETRRVALLKHPNIVQIYDFGKNGDHYFSVVEFVDGYSLTAWIRKAKILPSHTALLVTEGVAKALSYAWDKAGATHGALKPNNILVDSDGTIKVTDFGLSGTMRMIRKKEPHDPANSRPLILNYTAPEQRTGLEDADCRADLYALGALLYHMICGQMPASDIPNPFADFGPDPRAVKPELPSEVARLIKKLMAPNREHRPKDWGETLQDLLRVKSGNSPSGNFPPDTEAPAVARPIVPPKRRTVSVIVKTDPPAARQSSPAHPMLKIALSVLASLSRMWTRLLQKRDLQAGMLTLATLAIVILLFYPKIEAFFAPSKPATTIEPAAPPKVSPVSTPTIPKTPTKTPTQTQAPKTPPSASSELEDQRRFSETLAWARDNPDKIKEAATRFDSLASRTPATRTSTLAANEAKRLRTQLAQETLAEIRVQAEALATKGRFEEAAAFCEKYQGPFAAETAAGRAQLAERFRQEGKSLETNRQKASEQAEKQFHDAIASAISLFMTDKAPEALKIVEAASATPAADAHRYEMKNLAAALADSDALEATVLRSFQNTYNREITLALVKGPESFIITNVANDELQGMKIVKLGGGEVRQPRNVAFQELALSEIVTRLSQATPPQSPLVIGFVYFKAGDTEQAGICFEKTSPLIAPVLAEYLKNNEARRFDREAEETLIKIFKSTNIKLEEGPFSTLEALKALSQRNFTPREADILARYVETYRSRYGQTRFAAQAEPVLTAMASIKRSNSPSPNSKPAPDSTPATDSTSDTNGTARRFEATIEETSSDVVESVQNRLSDLNPGVTRFQIRVDSDEAGVVTGVEIRSPRLKDLAPLAAFSNLTRLVASGTGNDNLLGMVVPAPLKDLAPLAGRPLQDLNIGYTRVKDLTPLKGMPINNLNLQFTMVEDISPLKGMPLATLNMDGTDVRNFDALAGSPLRQLSLNRALILDVTPLKGLPLTSLQLRRTRIMNINGLQGMRLTHLDLSHTQIHSLSPLRSMPLQRLVIEGVPVSDLTPLAGMQLTQLFAGSSDVRDLAPLRGMPLTTLGLEFTSASDLAPLAGMPLESLNLRNTKVRDLTPLRGMPLRKLDLRQTEIKTLSPIRNLPIEELFIDNPDAFKQDIEGMLQIKRLNPTTPE